MTSTLSPNLGLNLQGTGDNQGTWGVVLNADLSILDLNRGGRLNISVAGSSDVTLTSTQARNFYQNLTGALTGNISLIFPATAGSYYSIKNATSGAYTITAKPSGGTGIVLPQGQTVLIFIDPDQTAAVAAHMPFLAASGGLSYSGSALQITANGVSNAMLRASGALAVIGRSANSSGNVADIQASAASDAVLRESGSVLGFGTIATGGIADSAVTTAKINASAVTTVKIADNNVTDAKLRTSAGLSVIGRSANTTGNVADITAATDGNVLRRSGTGIGFGTLTNNAGSGLGSAALKDTGTSGNVVALLDGANTWSAAQVMSLATASAIPLTLTSTDATSAAGPYLYLRRNSSVPATSLAQGAIRFVGRNSTPADYAFAQISGNALDVTAATEDGVLQFYVSRGGSQLAGAMSLAQGLYMSGETDPGVGKVAAGSFVESGTTLASKYLQLGLALINVQQFTSSGTYTPTSGAVKAVALITGGGGGGGGNTSGIRSQAGGGAGATALKFLSAAVLAVTIGAAGAAGGVGGGDGGGGGQSALGTTTANGGSGGSGSLGASLDGGNGSSTTSGATLAIPGGGGAGGQLGESSDSFTGGIGGSSFWGGGGAGGINAGSAGAAYGSGGSGAGNNTGVGGAGKAGVVVVWEFG